MFYFFKEQRIDDWNNNKKKMEVVTNINTVALHLAGISFPQLNLDKDIMKQINHVDNI